MYGPIEEHDRRINIAWNVLDGSIVSLMFV